MLTRTDKRTVIQTVLLGEMLKDKELSKKVFYTYLETFLKYNETEAKNALKEVIEEESIWKGYQEYNRIMREVNSDNYNYNSKEVAEKHEKLISFYSSI